MKPEISERIRLFRMVRDIPYYIAVGNEQDYCCATKPIILDKLLQTIGLKSRHIICEFRWEDLGLPKELLKLRHEDFETHEYLEVWIPERKKWVKVDPNWDSRIKHSKITIAEWDGLNNTKLAVIPTKTLSIQKSKEFIVKDATPAERNAYMKKNGKFFIAFNKWLESIRKPI